MNSNKVGMKRIDQITAILLLLLSGFIINESTGLKIQDQFGPGPGFFPLILGVLLAVLSLVLLINAIRLPTAQDEPSTFPGRQGAIAVIAVVAGLIGYAVLLERIGYILTTALFVAFLMGVVQRDKLQTTVLTAIGITLMLYLIFDLGLGIRLPQGPFGF